MEKRKVGESMEKSRLEYLMMQLEKSFIPEKAKGMEGVFQCHIPGEEGGDWLMTMKDQQCQITPGVSSIARATLTIESNHLDDLLAGKLDPLQAFFTGKIQLDGDKAAVIKLLTMFHLDPKNYQ